MWWVGGRFLGRWELAGARTLLGGHVKKGRKRVAALNWLDSSLLSWLSALSGGVASLPAGDP